MNWGLGLLEDRTSFPGRDEWRWHLQLEFERIASPTRALLVLAMAGWWLLAPHPQHSAAAQVWGLLGLCAVFTAIDLIVVYRYPGAVRRMPFGSALADLVLISLIVRASGGAASPFLPGFFVFSAGAAIRLVPRLGVVFSFLYAVAYALVAPAGGGFAVMTLLLLALSATLWSGHVRVSRVEHLRDALTGAFTRNYALFHLERLVETAQAPFTVGMIDVDRFKEVNDTYGHVAGDEVLYQYVRVIGGALRSQDLLARYGGDELLVLFADLRVDAALEVAERIRAAVESTAIQVRGQEVVHVTVSIGLFEAVPGMRSAELLRQVDLCLYASKRMRNEVTAVATG